jgi:hypothetical protein
MASLDLRSRESILKGGNAGPALVPGNAAESLIYKDEADRPCKTGGIQESKRL